MFNEKNTGKLAFASNLFFLWTKTGIVNLFKNVYFLFSVQFI